MSVALPQVKAKEQQSACDTAPPARSHKGLKLSDLKRGETGRIVRVAGSDAGCRKRFAEMGLAEGMKVTVTSAGETLMLQVGHTKMGLSARCAHDITVVRV